MNDGKDRRVYCVVYMDQHAAHSASDNDANKQMSEQIIKWINTMANENNFRLARSIQRLGHIQRPTKYPLCGSTVFQMHDARFVSALRIYAGSIRISCVLDG